MPKFPFSGGGKQVGLLQLRREVHFDRDRSASASSVAVCAVRGQPGAGAKVEGCGFIVDSRCRFTFGFFDKHVIDQSQCLEASQLPIPIELTRVKGESIVGADVVAANAFGTCGKSPWFSRNFDCFLPRL